MAVIGDMELRNAIANMESALGVLKAALPVAPPPPPPPQPPQPEPDSPPVSMWPDASNTGVPAGVLLKNVSALTTTSDGQVIEGLHISGVLTVRHKNVVIRHCLIEAASYWVILIMTGATGCQIERCKIVGGSGGIGAKGVHVYAAGCRVQRCDISSCEDGVYSGAGDLEILDNYVHALAGGTKPHYDGFQINGSNTTIRGNHLALDHPGVSSCLTFGNCSNIVIDRNLFKGGGYTTRFPNDRKITNVKLTNNRYGKHVYGYGVTGGMAGNIVVSGNVDDGTGANIDKMLGG